MFTPLDHVNDFLATHYGVDGATLFAPVDAEHPAGHALRGAPEWHAIRRARESDDSTLPRGAWVRDLKHAAWDQVAAATLDALANRSKDLQLAVWLAEALLHEHGFAGLATGIRILDTLTERYWETAFPLASENGGEHRGNLFRWLNDKLIAPARLVPLTVADGADRAYSWADCERLRLLERSAETHRERDSRDPGPAGAASGSDDPAGFTQAVRATSDDALLRVHDELEQAVDALLDLGTTLDRRFGDDAPGVGALRGQLEQIDAFVVAELRQRGVSTEIGEVRSEAAAIGYESGGAHRVDRDDAEGDHADARAQPVNGAPPGRARAYEQLAQAAAELVRLEPHSPVPYLIQRAIEWGQLNTTQLYAEVFIKCRGQLNIFELVGLQVEPAENA